MPITIHSDIELLALLVGQKKAERLYDGSLSALLTRASKGGAEYVRIATARELIRSAVAEELQEGSLLTSPQVVREYLRILFAAREAVAEGVEDKTDWDFLIATDVDIAQGYYISRPMPAADILRWHEEWRSRYNDRPGT